MAIRFVAIAAVVLTAGAGIQAVGAPDDHAFERLVVLRSDGTVLATVTGARSFAVIGPELDRELLTPGARLRIVHTHPAGTSLSAADLGQLAKPGVIAIEAVGDDGSRYSASAAPGHDPQWLEAALHPLALAAVRRHLIRSAPREHWREFDAHLAHLAAVALHKAGVVTYHADLGAARRESYRRHQVIFGQATESAAAVARKQARELCASRPRT